jgi:hypothetical protein
MPQTIPIFKKKPEIPSGWARYPALRFRFLLGRCLHKSGRMRKGYGFPEKGSGGQNPYQGPRKNICARDPAFPIA